MVLSFWLQSDLLCAVELFALSVNQLGQGLAPLNLMLLLLFFYVKVAEFLQITVEHLLQMEELKYLQVIVMYG